MVPRCFWDQFTVREIGLEMPTMVTSHRYFTTVWYQWEKPTNKTQSGFYRCPRKQQEIHCLVLQADPGKQITLRQEKAPGATANLIQGKVVPWPRCWQLPLSGTATCTNWERQEAWCYQGCQHIQHPASSCDSFQCFRRVNTVAKLGEDKNVLLSPQTNSCLRGSNDSRVGKQHAQQRGKSPANHLLWDYLQITHGPSLISYREVS